MSSKVFKAVDKALTTVYVVLLIGVMIFALDFTVMAVQIASTDQSRIINNANWELDQASQVIVFKIDLNLPRLGIFEKGVIVRYGISLDGNSVTGEEFIITGRNYYIRAYLQLSQYQYAEINSGAILYYSIHMTIIPLFSGMQLDFIRRDIDLFNIPLR